MHRHKHIHIHQTPSFPNPTASRQNSLALSLSLLSHSIGQKIFQLATLQLHACRCTHPLLLGEVVSQIDRTPHPIHISPLPSSLSLSLSLSFSFFLSFSLSLARSLALSLVLSRSLSLSLPPSPSLSFSLSHTRGRALQGGCRSRREGSDSAGHRQRAYEHFTPHCVSACSNTG
jgi:hypothetical protein